MSVDVEHTIVAIIEKFGEKTSEEAKEYFLQMQNEGQVFVKMFIKEELGY